MSKELEQLRQIRHDFYINGEVDYDSISYFTNIERALKELEIIKKVISINSNRQLRHSNLWNLPEKEFKLLERALSDGK